MSAIIRHAGGVRHDNTSDANGKPAALVHPRQEELCHRSEQ